MAARPVLSLSVPLRQAFHHLPRPARRIHNAPLLKPQTRPQHAFRPPHFQSPNQRRHGSFVANATDLFRKNPWSVTMAAIVILSGAASIIYANYIYQTYIIGAFHKFPEPVAKKLRKALYYTNIDLQPKEALKFYKQALMVAEEIQMDPFSDEIIGVKIQLAKMLEDINAIPMSIEVLERTREDNMRWLREYGHLENNKMRRTTVLSKSVGISVKLGELYGHPVVWDRDMAQERLMWAVETVLKEQQRRQNDNVKIEDEGEWMSPDQIGAALESLAHSYEAKDQHYLAAPLFLQALNLYPAKDCHQIVLMNNLASSLAQQSPQAAREVQAYATSQSVTEKPTGPVATKQSMVENAKLWAQKAIDAAAVIQPPERTEECDMGCAVAMHNMGEFAEMSNDLELAKQKYKEAVGLARAIGFQEGVEQSSARLRELSKAG